MEDSSQSLNSNSLCAVLPEQSETYFSDMKEFIEYATSLTEEWSIKSETMKFLSVKHQEL